MIDVEVDPASWREIKESQIRRKLAEHVRDRSTDMAANSGAIPADVYTDAARWAAEKREIFLKLPMLACLSADIPEPGDTILYEASGPSIIVLRGKDRHVHAYLNMCTHRAARLVKDCGRNARLTCPFHAWTFNLEGKLIGVPRREAFDPEHLAGRNLVRVPVGEWAGMVFVIASPGDERIDVAAHLGGFAETMASLELEKATPVIQGRLDFEANWKYALDTYNEGYHVGVLHKETVGALYYGDLITVERHGVHHRQSFATDEFATTATIPEAEWDGLAFSPSYFIFPNISINRQPMSRGRASVMIQRVFPGDEIGKGFALVTTYRVTTYRVTTDQVTTDGVTMDRAGNGAADPAQGDDNQDYIDAHHLIMRVVGEEDFSVSKGGYDNLGFAPPGFQPLFGRNEHPAFDVERFIADAIGFPF